MLLLDPHVWADMDGSGTANGTQEELRLLPPPDDGYEEKVATNLLFDDLNLPEDPIRLLSVQVVVLFSHRSLWTNIVQSI